MAITKLYKLYWVDRAWFKVADLSSFYIVSAGAIRASSNLAPSKIFLVFFFRFPPSSLSLFFFNLLIFPSTLPLNHWDVLSSQTRTDYSVEKGTEPC